MAEITFDVIIDDTLYKLCNIGNPDTKKKVLGEINDFEGGDWRYERFNDYIMNNVVKTALSTEERKKIPDCSFTALKRACKNLRILETKDNGRGSEIAEILLYGIMNDHFKALPAVAKIFYKQNVNDYAKGSDGVHIVLNDKDFSLWYGEAKFYKSLDNSNLKVIAESVLNSLNPEKMKKENVLAKDLNDLSLLLDSNPQKEKIFKYLDYDTSLDEIKKKLHIPIMVLYECEITNSQKVLTEEYKDKLRLAEIEKAKDYFSIQDEVCKNVFLYDKIEFHLIFFPVPNKDKIVDSFINTVNIFRS